MAFIDTMPATSATGPLRDMYGKQERAYGYVPNYAKTFSHRPQVMQLWADLQKGIRQHIDRRRYELVTVAAAMAVRSTYCSLAHGQMLTEFYSQEDVLAIVNDSPDSPLSPSERMMFRFAGKIARDATSVTAAEVDELRTAGFGDAEIFDIAAAATARSFFAQLCEGLGTIGDHAYPRLDPSLKDALTVGRPLEFSDPERLSPERALA
jgi:uncharacterized peroxidase-related enzyme